jgi:hypothetical protein
LIEQYIIQSHELPHFVNFDLWNSFLWTKSYCGQFIVRLCLIVGSTMTELIIKNIFGNSKSLGRLKLDLFQN